MKKNLNFKVILFLTGLICLFKTMFLNSAHTYANQLNTIKENVLIVGTNATFHPFEYKDENGEIIGFDIELINLIAKHLNVKVELVDMPFDGLLASLGNKIDLVIAGLTKTPEREQYADFSSTYFQGKQCILTLKNRNIQNKDSLKNCTIASQIGTTANDFSKTLNDIKTKDYNDYDIMVEDLLRNRFDAIILDEIAAINQINKHYGKIKITNGSILGCPVEDYSIACKKGNKNLINAINSAILKIQSTNEYKNLFNKHLNIKIKQTNNENKKSLKNQFYSAFIEKSRYMLYFKGLLTTLTVAFFAAILGFLLGSILAMAKVIKNKNEKTTLISKLANFYISAIRGTPVLVQLLIMWLVIFKNAKNGVFVAIISFGLNSAAYVAEIIRGAIEAIDIGQTEAGISLGFSKTQTLFYIVLPQSLKNSIPSLCNEFISLIKETAVVGYVALNDLTRAAFSISAASYQTFMPLLLTAIIYFIITKIISLILEFVKDSIR